MQFEIQQKHTVISTLINSQHNSQFNSQSVIELLSCNEHFYRQTTSLTDEVKRKAQLLIDSCLYQSTDNGNIVFQFNNGLEIIQLPCGHTRFVEFVSWLNLSFSY